MDRRSGREHRRDQSGVRRPGDRVSTLTTVIRATVCATATLLLIPVASAQGDDGTDPVTGTPTTSASAAADTAEQLASAAVQRSPLRGELDPAGLVGPAQGIARRLRQHQGAQAERLRLR